MTENDPQPKLRFDDFVAAVQPDPAKPQATILLAGYLGHGAEGHVRVYRDAALNAWDDVPEADVVHSIPMPEAKLGGSYVWVRASAELKPGSAAAAGGAALAGGAMPAALHAQTNPPTLGCSGGCNVVGGAAPPPSGTMHQCCGVEAAVGTQFTNYFGCTAGCAPGQAMAPPPSGTMHQCCGAEAGVGTQFTNFFGCTAACPPAQAMAPPPSGTMHQCCGVEAVGTQFTNFFGCTAACPPAQAMAPPPTANCLTLPPRCGLFTPFCRQ
jgi:hypothetical protein